MGCRCFQRSEAVTGPAAIPVARSTSTASPPHRTGALLSSRIRPKALYTVNPVTGASRLLFAPIGPDGILYEAGRLWVAEPL